MIANPSKYQATTIESKDKCINEFEIDQEFAFKIEKTLFCLVFRSMKIQSLMLISIRSIKKQLNL